MKVRVLMKLTPEGQPFHYNAPGVGVLGAWVPATPNPKRFAWRKDKWVWVEGSLVEDLGRELSVELVTTAGRLVFMFDKCDVNLHGLVRKDERLLLQACQLLRREGDLSQGTGCIVKTLQIHPNRALRYLEKWERRGWWECGVGTWFGWITPQGMEAKL